MKKLITLGLIDKNIFLPFLLAIFLIINSYVGAYIPEANQSYYIAGFGQSIGFMLARFIPCIFKYDTEISFKKNCTKNNIKDYFFFFIFYTLFRGAALTNHFIEFDTSRVSFLSSTQSIQIIILLILTKIFLKYNYYIHNIISLILFCIFGALVDLASGSFKDLKLVDGYYFFVIVTESIFYCSMKYMMDKKYHKYWDIIFFQGIYNFIYIMISVFIRAKIDNDASFIPNYFSQKEIGPVFAIFFYNMFITGLMQQVLNVLIIYLFTPNHIFISYGINKIKKIVYKNTEDYYHLFCLIPFFFQILSLLFYLEILEYNFCNLNKDTKRNIELRENDDMKKKLTNESFIEINDDLIIENDEFNQELTMVSIGKEKSSSSKSFVK